MKKINRRSFLAAAGLTAAALALTACGGSASSTASSTASSAASSEAASTSAAAELTTVEAGKLTMATNAAFPPYEMTTDAGEFEGIDIDTAKAIAEKLGLELQIDDMDFDAALLSVQQGKADIVMAGVTVTDERKAVMDFSDSYATGIQSIIVPEGSDIASPDDLAGKKIGTQRGTTGYIYCTDDFGEDAVVAYDSGLTAVQALNNGQVDAVVIDNAPAKEFIAEQTANGITVIKADEAAAVDAMAAKILEHPIASRFFASGVAEQSMFWRDEDTRVMLRGRSDWINEDVFGRPVVVDYKTTARTADPTRFGWEARDYRYHMQDAWYREGPIKRSHEIRVRLTNT